jgi:hypothetical protein
LAGEQYTKRGVDRAQAAVAEIRFHPRLHLVDGCGPEEKNLREGRREQYLLGLSCPHDNKALIAGRRTSVRNPNALIEVGS